MMTGLKLKEHADDLFIIKKMKKSLAKSFKPTRENDIDNAVVLSNYLLCLGKIEEAGELLNSFIYLDPNAQKDHLWPANGQGIILLAYIARIGQRREEEQSLVELIYAEDIVDTFNYTKYELYLTDFEDHDKTMDLALNETQKYKCSIIGQEALTFLYFYEMLPFYKEEVPDGFKAELEGLYLRCYTKLKVALLNG